MSRKQTDNTIAKTKTEVKTNNTTQHRKLMCEQQESDITGITSDDTDGLADWSPQESIVVFLM